MNLRNKATLLLALLGIFDVISVFFPITASMGIYVIWKRPKWFLDFVHEIYHIKNS